MMDGLDDLTGEEREHLKKVCEVMRQNPRAIVMGKSRLKSLNAQVGQRIKLHGVSYTNILFECEIIRRTAGGEVRERGVHE